MRVVAAAAVVLVAAGGCAPSSDQRSLLLQSGAPLLLISGEDEQPVSGASVLIGGRRFVSGADGRVDLDPLLDGDVDVAATNFLVRETALPSGRTLTLWPTSPGYPEDYIRHLLYKEAASTRGEPSPSSDAPLRRVMAALVQVVPDPALWDDAPARGAHARAVDLLNEATEGHVRFELRRSAQGPGVVFRAYVDGTATAAGALTYRDLVRNEITSGRIVYANLGAARSERFVAHELGHALGLQHSIRPRDLMYFSAPQAAAAAFSDEERLSIRLLLQRRAGNRYPDNDRTVSGSADLRVTSVVAD